MSVDVSGTETGVTAQLVLNGCRACAEELMLEMMVRRVHWAGPG